MHSLLDVANPSVSRCVCIYCLMTALVPFDTSMDMFDPVSCKRHAAPEVDVAENSFPLF